MKNTNNGLEDVNIHNVYPKKNKKSISFFTRIDIFIIICIVILILTPLFISLFSQAKPGRKKVEIFLSPRCEEIFGKSLTDALLNEYAKRNPDLRIKISLGGMNSKNDILVFDEAEYYKLIEEEAFASLWPYLHNENSRQSAIPLVTFFDLFFYNIDILTAAGFDRPPKTRDDFLAYAKTISQKNGDLNTRAGAAFALSQDDYEAVRRDIFSWIWAAGGDFWHTNNELNEKPRFNTRSIINDISFLGKLYSEGVFAPDGFSATGEQRLEEFADGKIAMILASSRAIPFLRNRMGNNTFGLTNIPGTAGMYSTGLSGIYAGISVGCLYLDEAWNFLLFLAEQSPLLCAGLEAVPGAVSDLSAGKYIKDEPLNAKAWSIFESAEIAYGFSGTQYGHEYEMIVLEELQDYFNGGKTVEKAIAAIQERWDTLQTIEETE